MMSIKLFNKWHNEIMLPNKTVYRQLSDKFQGGYVPKDREEVRQQCEVYNVVNIIENGPKLFSPDEETFDALRNTELCIPGELYKQPFETLVVLNPHAVEVDSPFCIAGTVCKNNEEESVLALVAPRFSEKMYAPIINIGKRFGTIEESLKQMNVMPKNDNFMDDYIIMCELVRVYVNSCMLLTNYESKITVKSSNEILELSLRNTLAKKKIPDAVRRSAEEALHNLPMVYGFDQSVRIYETEDGPRETTGTGHPVKPHWRRGHWRHQPYGKEMGLRKLIFIPAVLVNAYRFAGDLGNTRTSYHTAGAK